MASAILSKAWPAFAILFVSLAGCAKPCGWYFSRITTDYCRFNSGKIFLSYQQGICPMELEISRGSYGVRMYLNLTTFSALPCPSNPCMADIHVSSQGFSESFCAVLFEGGQRLLIPPEIVDHLIEQLWNQETLCFQVGYLQGIFSPKGFQKAYRNLLRIPISHSAGTSVGSL